LRLFSFGGYGLALAALALVVFGAYDSYPSEQYVAEPKSFHNQATPPKPTILFSLESSLDAV